MIHPVILCGGSGSRLWPMSRAHYPKQFLPLLGRESLLQQTLARVARGERFAAPIVVCNEEHRFIVAEQLRAAEVAADTILLEPVSRNTAPAACVAALHALADEPEALILLLPADHAIGDVDAFHAAIDIAARAAREGHLVTFGVAPTHPETGYGYIRRGEPLGGDCAGAHAIGGFVEKPDAATAAGYVDSGDYLWNGGIFLLPAARFLDELARLRPGIVAACREALARAKPGTDYTSLDLAAFSACPSDSIDYAVMEHTKLGAVVPVAMAWSDVGSWNAIWEASERDADGNATLGDVVLEDTKGCYVRSEAGLVTAVGVEDLVIVATDDAVMIAPRGHAQQVKDLVARLKANGRTEVDSLPTVHRPWGTYRPIHLAERVQVKHITVKPGGRLSLQMHHHRAEHWVVVQGTAKVVRGNEETILSEDQSTYIPLGTPHRLENPGKIPLHLIEVQSGSYLGEDDIVRFEDHYGRS